ncbi:MULTISPECIES: helix-turn-helix domain-containing protein [Lysinibacillus]|nr:MULTISPECIES: helix-turn-helix domain-containing protein [Lysinibacillus]
MMTEKIKILLLKEDVSIKELAKRLNTTPQNITNKFKRDNFSEKELLGIAEALNVEYTANFITSKGEKI